MPAKALSQNLPLPVCCWNFKKIQWARVFKSGSVLREKKNDKNDSGLVMQANPTQTAGGILLSVIPSYKQNLSATLLRNREQEAERWRERDKGVKQLTWMVKLLDLEIKWSMWERESCMLCLPLSLSLPRSMPGYSRFTVSVRHSAFTLPFCYH